MIKLKAGILDGGGRFQSSESGCRLDNDATKQGIRSNLRKKLDKHNAI